MPYAIID